jgi:hypothetical protein
MSETMTTYNRYIEEEDKLYKQLNTLELCQCALFDHISRYGKQFNKLTAEEVLLNINELEVNVRLELLHVRMEKAFLAHGMKHNL